MDIPGQLLYGEYYWNKLLYIILLINLYYTEKKY